jgi:hypothetical protein
LLRRASAVQRAPRTRRAKWAAEPGFQAKIPTGKAGSRIPNCTEKSRRMKPAADSPLPAAKEPEIETRISKVGALQSEPACGSRFEG